VLSAPDQAVWLIPPQFRRFAFEQRGSLWEIAGRTSDPSRASANLLAREELFTNLVAGEAAALALAFIEVDGSLSAYELTDRVAERLKLTGG